jgi:hypothetical protein
VGHSYGEGNTYIDLVREAQKEIMWGRRWLAATEAMGAPQKY